MDKVILRTRIKNTSGQDALFRWIAPRGQYLKDGEDVIVDGAYPASVQNKRFVSSCEYDIENDRVEVLLITNLGVRKPTAKELTAAGPSSRAVPAPAPGVEDEKVKLQDQNPVDGPGNHEERWQQGTIEGSKPDPITLPGHEDTLKDAEAMQNPAAAGADGPQTLEIFKEGTALGEDKRAEDEAAQVEQKKAADATGADKAPPADPPAEKPKDKPRGVAAKKQRAARKTRKSARKTAK